MRNDLRLVRLEQLHISARTLDFAFQPCSQVQVVLGTRRTVDEVRTALAGVRIWNAPVGELRPSRWAVPPQAESLFDAVIAEHLSVHDGHGGDVVVGFLDGQMYLHDNSVGVHQLAHELLARHPPAHLPGPHDRGGPARQPQGHAGGGHRQRHRTARSAR